MLFSQSSSSFLPSTLALFYYIHIYNKFDILKYKFLIVINTEKSVLLNKEMTTIYKVTISLFTLYLFF